MAYRFFTVPSAKHVSWEEPVHISFFSNFSLSEGGSNSQSLGRQMSVLPLNQIPSHVGENQCILGISTFSNFSSGKPAINLTIPGSASLSVLSM